MTEEQLKESIEKSRKGELTKMINIELSREEIKKIIMDIKSGDWYFGEDESHPLLKKLYEALGMEPNYKDLSHGDEREEGITN